MSKQSEAMINKCVFVSLTLVAIHIGSCAIEGCNVTRRRRADEGTFPDGSSKQRYPRLLTFHTQDNDVIVGANRI